MSNEERFDSVMETSIMAFPKLEKLQLGHYNYVPDQKRVWTEWGKSLLWEEFVEKRFNERVKVERAWGTLEGDGGKGLLGSMSKVEGTDNGNGCSAVVSLSA